MALLHNLLLFARILRGAGIDVPAGAMADAAQALLLVGLRRRSDVRSTLGAVLVRRKDDLETFDAAFDLFFRGSRRGEHAQDLRALGERRKFKPPERDVAGHEFQLGQQPSAAPTLGGGTPVGAAPTPTYSRQEALRAKDFAAYGPDEIAEAESYLAAMRWEPGLRRSRRWRPARRGRLDLRRVLSGGVRFGGELVELGRAARVVEPRPLIVLCDVSGSMERYSRMLLHFLHGMRTRRSRVEVFLFATRLSRVTREAGERHVDAFVTALPRVSPDFAGGTRIGEALRTFNVVWARRVIRRGPIVLLISDGWDRGDPELLATEMARLHRSVRRLIWLNPLLGSAAYQPLTRGMQAALPHVDDFLPVHNLDSLEALARELNDLGGKWGRSMATRRHGRSRRASHDDHPPQPTHPE